MNELVNEWVVKAESDLEAADLLLRGGEHPLPDASCFHSQQCAEKYLKAFLLEHQIPFERKHPLIPLLESCLVIDNTFEDLRDDLIGLESFAVGVRYPGVNVSAKIAEKAIASATRVRNFIRTKLSL